MTRANHTEKAREIADQFSFWGTSPDPGFKRERERCAAIIAQALADERRAALEDVIDYLTKYRRAYAEDLFTPIGKSSDEPLPTNQSEMGVYTTRVSAHMGRFLLDNIIRDLPALAEEDAHDQKS